MPLAPLSITLSDGQKLEALKRMRKHYQDAIEKITTELTDVLTAQAEAEFLAAYLGEQPEIKELRSGAAKAEELEKRRQYLARLIERLESVIPATTEVHAPAPTGAGAGKPSGIRKF